MGHEKIEMPAAFDADCDKCFLKCDKQERVDKRLQCIRAYAAYIEGYKAARDKFSKRAAIAYRDGYEAAWHRCLLQQRVKLADFLLLKCPVDALDNYELISDFVRRGESLEEILRLDATSRRPEAEILLKALLVKELK